MFARRIHRSLKKFRFSKNPSFASLALSVRDIANLYGLSDEFLKAGALLDTFLRYPDSADMAYVNWKGALIPAQKDPIHSLVSSVFEMNITSLAKKELDSLCRDDAERFLLKLAILCQQASVLPALNDKHIESWFCQTRLITEICPSIFPEKYSHIFKDMRAFLEEALVELETLQE